MLLFIKESSSGSSWAHVKSVHLTSQEREHGFTRAFEAQVLRDIFVFVITMQHSAWLSEVQSTFMHLLLNS